MTIQILISFALALMLASDPCDLARWDSQDLIHVHIISHGIVIPFCVERLFFLCFRLRFIFLPLLEILQQVDSCTSADLYKMISFKSAERFFSFVGGVRVTIRGLPG